MPHPSDPHCFLVIDDHESVLQGTVPALQSAYPEAQIVTAKDAQAALQSLELYAPTLVVVDLSLPDAPGAPATPTTGLNLVQHLLSSELAPNIVVLSTDINPLVRLKAVIKAYEGGFAALDKSLPIQEMLSLVGIALRGSIYLPQKVKSRPEFHHRWIELMQLKFESALTDKAIAKRMNVSDRTIRNYWIRIQDTLALYDDPDKEMRIQIEIEARKMGLIS